MRETNFVFRCYLGLCFLQYYATLEQSSYAHQGPANHHTTTTMPQQFERGYKTVPQSRQYFSSDNGDDYTGTGPSRVSTITSPTGRGKTKPTGPSKGKRPSGVSKHSDVQRTYIPLKSPRSKKGQNKLIDDCCSGRSNTTRPSSSIQTRHRGPKRNPQIPTLIRPSYPKAPLCASRPRSCARTPPRRCWR